MLGTYFKGKSEVYYSKPEILHIVKGRCPLEAWIQLLSYTEGPLSSVLEAMGIWLWI